MFRKPDKNFRYTSQCIFGIPDIKNVMYTGFTVNERPVCGGLLYLVQDFCFRKKMEYLEYLTGVDALSLAVIVVVPVPALQNLLLDVFLIFLKKR